ncbi:MAG: electron transfer flavoprotein subunit alpha/FixB family protein [Georgfuchsia sp.]
MPIDHKDALEIWVYLDDRGGVAKDMPFRMAAECRRHAEPLGLRVCGVAHSATVAQGLISSGRCSGLDTIYALSDAQNCSENAVAQIAAQLCRAIDKRRPQMMLFPATVPETEIGARVAAQIGCAFLGRCVDLEWEDGRPIARRSVYGGRAHQVLCPVGGPPWIATIDPLILDNAPASGTGSPTLEILLDSISENPECVPQDIWRLSARELDLLDADIVLSVGKGVKNSETLKQVHELAELLGATVGGSREAVFDGLVTRDRQVGASGKWIAPRVYIALGISGSTYHMMGIRETKHLVAVNVDARAPIIEQAEIGIVADVENIVPALIATLKNEADNAPRTNA